MSFALLYSSLGCSQIWVALSTFTFLSQQCGFWTAKKETFWDLKFFQVEHLFTGGCYSKNWTSITMYRFPINGSIKNKMNNSLASYCSRVVAVYCRNSPASMHAFVCMSVWWQWCPLCSHFKSFCFLLFTIYWTTWYCTVYRTIHKKTASFDESSDIKKLPCLFLWVRISCHCW